MSSDSSNWELFATQSEFFWRFQQMVALVEAGVFSGWYTLFTNEMKFLAAALLAFGSFILFVLFLIVKRASQYLNALRGPALKALPTNIPPPLFNLPTHKIGFAIPIALLVFNVLLFVYTVASSPPSLSPYEPRVRKDDASTHAPFVQRKGQVV